MFKGTVRDYILVNCIFVAFSHPLIILNIDLQ